jgi:hypothetical protein
MKNRKTTVDADELEVAVGRLTEEVRILRQSIDEFREDFVHLLRNLPQNLPPPYAHLHTLAESFAVDSRERVEPPKAMVTAVPESKAKSVGSSGSPPKKKTLFE